MPSPSHFPVAKRRVALEARNSELARDLRQSLQPSFEVLEGVSWLPSGNGVLVVAVMRLDEATTRNWVRERREAALPAPTLLVTSQAPDNLIHLGDVVVEGVWGIEDEPSRLHVLIRQLMREDALERLAQYLEDASVADALVRRALLEVLTAEPPFRTVKRLVHALGTSRTAIHERWKSTVRPASLPVSAILGLVALYRAARMAARGKPIPEACESVGWSRKRLSRVAETYLQVPLVEGMGDGDRIVRELWTVVDAICRSKVSEQIAR